MNSTTSFLLVLLVWISFSFQQIHVSWKNEQKCVAAENSLTSMKASDFIPNKIFYPGDEEIQNRSMNISIVVL